MTTRPSDGAAQPPRPVPDLCPTSARPRASRHAGLPDLPTFRPPARNGGALFHSPHVTDQVGQVGQVGKRAIFKGFPVPDLCPTSAKVGHDGGAVVFGAANGGGRTNLNGDAAGSPPANLNGGPARGSSLGGRLAGNSGPDFRAGFRFRFWFRRVGGGSA